MYEYLACHGDERVEHSQPRCKIVWRAKSTEDAIEAEELARPHCLENIFQV